MSGADLEKRLADLEKQVAELASFGPIRDEFARRRRAADEQRARQRIRDLIALPPADRAVAILDAEDLGGLTSADTLAMLRGLELDGAAWRAVAAVSRPTDVAAARIAALPATPRVTVRVAKPWDSIRVETVIDDATARRLKADGHASAVCRNRRGESLISIALRGAESERDRGYPSSLIFTAAELDALTATLPELLEAIGDGRVTVQVMGDEESRSIDLRAIAP